MEALNFKVIFRALRNKNYRLFFTGQSVSLVGTWMQQMAMSWLVYRLTNSPFLLGLVVFAGQIPAFIITPLAGVIADRHNKHRILLFTQILAMAQAVVLSALVFANSIKVWQIFALSVLLGIINAFDIPVRQAFTIDMIENKEDLGNAIALNSSIVNLARLLGPSAAGIIIALFGEGPCFLLNALSYIAVIISLLLMNIKEVKARPPQRHILLELKEGFDHAFKFPPIRYILLILGLVSLAGNPYQVLMPVFARDIFHGGPQTLGFLMAMSGLGALSGAIYLAGKRGLKGLGRAIAVASLLFGIGIMIFSQSRVLWFSMAVIYLAAFAMMVQMAASNTILQTISDEDKRGRVMSFYVMAFIGVAPFGSLLAGALADKIGAPYTLLLGGLSCVIGSLVFFSKLPIIRKHIRPVYVKKGIITEVAKGIRAASGS